MSKQTKKLLNGVDKSAGENSGVQGENELCELFEKLMVQYPPERAEDMTEEDAETSDDFLELAESAESERSALKYAKKALELDPDNIEAAMLVIELSSASLDKCIEKYKKLIESADKRLEAEGYFDDDSIGKFWLIFETRPYMRLLSTYADACIQCGKMRLSIEIHEKMLRLCEGDNIGARYRLMNLYALFEDERSALGLFEKYPEEDSVMFLLPLSILYYKLGNLRESEKYLKRMSAVNKDTRKFFDSLIDGTLDKYIDNADHYGYRPCTIEEYLEEVRGNHFLLAQSSAYFEWAWQKLKAARKKK